MSLAAASNPLNGQASAPQIGGAAALALENQRLRAELTTLSGDVRRSRARLIEAADAERRRIERNLHDGAQQQLVTIALKLNLLRPRIATEPAAAATLVDEVVEELMRATDELRGLAVGVHPPALAEAGLAEALLVLADRAPFPVKVTSVPEQRLRAMAETTIYFVVAEALTNVAKHANARSATVSVTDREGTVTVEVRDDGAGGADPSAGTGLRGLAERVAALGGQLDVAGVVGGGTLVRAVFRSGCAEPAPSTPAVSVANA